MNHSVQGSDVFKECLAIAYQIVVMKHSLAFCNLAATTTLRSYTHNQKGKGIEPFTWMERVKTCDQNVWQLSIPDDEILPLCSGI